MSDLSLRETKKEWHGTIRAYVIGFTLSLVLTMISFSIVAFKLFSGPLLLGILIALGVIQATVQLICFLHIGQEPKPRWETISFGFTLMVLLIVVMGSLWIMHDLDERMMPGMENMEGMHHD